MLNRTLSPALMPNNEAINYRARVSERVFSSMRILQMCIKCPNLFLGVIVCGFFFLKCPAIKKESISLFTFTANTKLNGEY